MDFIIKNNRENIASMARKIGYLIIDTKDGPEYNMVRKLNRDNYPRFHIYTKMHGTDYQFGLHLDQKAPVYAGQHAHNGEYWGPVVEEEAERIQELLNA